MSTTRRNYIIRLSAAGNRELERDLKSAGVAGERALKRIQAATTPAGAGLKATNRAAKDLKGGLRGVSNELPAIMRLSRFLGTTALVSGIVAFGKTSLDVGKQFQAAMKRVEAATQAPEGDMKRLQDAAREMGATTAFTAIQAADAIEVLAKNGLDVETILGGALDATLNVAGALGGDLAKSADLATDLMAQFNLEAAALPEIADRVAGAALKSKFGFEDLRLAIGQAGGVAGQFGVDIDDFLTSLAATAPAFASGSDAGTSFKTFLQRLTPDSDKARDAMQELGLEFFDTQGRMKEMGEIAGELQAGIAGLSEEARNEALKTIFGTDAIRTALLLANTGAAGFSDLAAALKEVSAQDQAQVRLEGLDGALKELAAAWEAVQLSAAENGGLEIAEDAADRLTAALRYLSENFEEVEEVVERVAQALTVYLVGRGINIAIARAVAMRATYIQLAGAVSGVGTSATRALGPISKLGVGIKVLTGTLGGPLGLAVTAASILSLGLDIDKTSDALDDAGTASDNATDALAEYEAATRRAKEEQKKFKGEVSDATEELVKQGRAASQIALSDLKKNLAGLRPQLLKDLGQQEFILRKASQVSSAFPELADFLQEVREGRKSVAELEKELRRLGGVGPEVSELIDRFQTFENIDAATADLVKYADAIGGFEDELRAIKSAEDDIARMEGVRALVTSLERAATAGTYIRSDAMQGLLEIVAQVGALEGGIDDVTTSLDNFGETLDSDGRPTVLSEAADDAQTATDRINEASSALSKMKAAHHEYASSRIAGERTITSEVDAILKQTGSASDSVSASAVLLRNFEGYRSTPYDDGPRDKNGNRVGPAVYRAGYGSDTTQLSDGTILKITRGMRVSVEDSNRDLRRRIGEFQRVIIGQVGAERFGQFNAAQQAVLTSVAYNYGSLPKRIVEAVRLGTDEQIASSIFDLRADNGGINSRRRNAEAEVFRSGIGVEAAAGRSDEVAREAADARKREVETMAQLVAVGDDHLAQLALENEMAGKTAGEQARLLFIYERMTEAKRAGIDVQTQLTADGRLLIDVINAQADAIARRSEEQEIGTIRTQEEIGEIERSTNAVKSAFDNFRAGGEGFKGFFADLFGFMADRLWDMALDPVWDNLGESLSGLLQPSTGGGGGGIWTAIVGALFGKKKADGGPIEGFANGGMPGGRIRGAGGRRQDNIPIWASAGEFMQPSASVDYYGADFMEAIRQRRLPRPQDDLSFSAGGMMGGSRSGSYPSSPSQAQVHVKTETSPYFRQTVRVESADVASRLDQVTTKTQNMTLMDRSNMLNLRGTS
ncbi:phage tail tape measure protein [uncultured Sulfitobacter sp.]|uniref:phage tail tape measure protein n=1 Tax=uncultured Sulfitobacter sp. TaxID=191468 RepID=UPI002611D0A5|nr:phage tail tape measure protein [uncultured Sulfitobacter sp.]